MSRRCRGWINGLNYWYVSSISGFSSRLNWCSHHYHRHRHRSIRLSSVTSRKRYCYHSIRYVMPLLQAMAGRRRQMFSICPSVRSSVTHKILAYRQRINRFWCQTTRVVHSRPVCQPSDNWGRFPQILTTFSGFENWSSQWLSRGNLDY